MAARALAWAPPRSATARARKGTSEAIGAKTQVPRGPWSSAVSRRRQKAGSEVGNLVVLDLVEQRAVADFQHFCGAGAVALRLLERAPDQDLFDRGGGLLDRELAGRELHLHRVEGLANALGQVLHLDEFALGEDHGAL